MGRLELSSGVGMSGVLLGLGSNLGNREEYLSRAVESLEDIDGVRVLCCSSIYESAPVGYLDQPDFLNMVVGVETSIRPDALLEKTMGIERDCQRVRDVRDGPRTLDIDLLFYEDLQQDSPGLKLPHPRALERSFVVIPLCEVLRHDVFLGAQWDFLRMQLGACDSRLVEDDSCRKLRGPFRVRT